MEMSKPTAVGTDKVVATNLTPIIYEVDENHSIVHIAPNGEKLNILDLDVIFSWSFPELLKSLLRGRLKVLSIIHSGKPFDFTKVDDFMQEYIRRRIGGLDRRLEPTVITFINDGGEIVSREVNLANLYKNQPDKRKKTSLLWIGLLYLVVLPLAFYLSRLIASH